MSVSVIQNEFEPSEENVDIVIDPSTSSLLRQMKLQSFDFTIVCSSHEKGGTQSLMRAITYNLRRCDKYRHS